MAEHLTKQTFQEKIFNYEKNQEWKYEANLQQLLIFGLHGVVRVKW